jgi:hypothetical protein
MFTIFEKLGGLAISLQLLQPTAIRDTWPTAQTYRKWRAQKQLPGPVVRRLMEICDERGVSYRASDFAWTDDASDDDARAAG